MSRQLIIMIFADGFANSAKIPPFQTNQHLIYELAKPSAKIITLQPIYSAVHRYHNCNAGAAEIFTGAKVTRILTLGTVAATRASLLPSPSGNEKHGDHGVTPQHVALALSFSATIMKQTRIHSVIATENPSEEKPI